MPVDEGVAEVASALGIPTAELTLGAGEDYELLVCAPPPRQGALERAADLTWIGRVTSGSGVRAEGTAVPGGFQHAL